jgi:thiosulfate dehydrogenase [quinone] large subunit
MSESTLTSATSSVAPSGTIATVTTTLYSRSEYVAAFLLLRLWVGLRTFLAGLEKFESKGRYSVAAYNENMDHMASGITGASFLPLWATKNFAHAIGYVLLLLGVAVLLGLHSRIALFLTGLTYVALSFGLMAVQESEGVAWLGIHMALIVGALLLVRHERFAIWATND